MKRFASLRAMELAPRPSLFIHGRPYRTQTCDFQWVVLTLVWVPILDTDALPTALTDSLVRYELLLVMEMIVFGNLGKS